MHPQPAVITRLCDRSEIIDLRHRCLRAGLPRDSAVFDGDAEPQTLHAAVEAEGNIIGCATFVQRPWDNQPAWQLRGMAVDSTTHRRGVGRMLLTFLEAAAIRTNFSLQLWCNARVPAVGFYQKMGWVIVSEVFEIPTAGPHVKMIKRLIRQ